MIAFKKYIQSLIPISDNDFESSMRFFKKINLKKNEYFIKQGEVCKEVGFIFSGSLRTFYVIDSGEEITSCFCTENNLTTSYKSFVLQEPSDLNIQAMEDSQLIIIDNEHLHELYSKNSIWQTVGRLIAEQEYISMEKYASVLNNESAKEKYQRLLKEQPDVIKKAKIEDIASYLGITRRTLSRIRKDCI